MKGALLPQNDNLVLEKLKPHVGRSVFDLSYSTMFPVDLDGAILPICIQEAIPSDSFEISVEILLRQLQPLLVPTMTNLRVNTAFYYCSNRLGWKKFDRFMQGGRSGNEVYELPTMYNSLITKDNVNYKVLLDIQATQKSTQSSPAWTSINGKPYNLLHCYFNCSHNMLQSSNGALPTSSDNLLWSQNNLPLAFPFFDYQLICRDYYTNVDRLPDMYDIDNFYDYSDPFSDWSYFNLFPQDDDEIRLQDGPHSGSGFTSGDDTQPVGVRGFVLDKIRYHDFREDYFTSSKKAPMRGTIPTIDTSIQSTIDATNLVYGNDETETSSVLGSGLALSSDGKLITTNIYNNKNSDSESFDVTNSSNNVLRSNLISSSVNSSKVLLNNALSKLGINNTTIRSIKMADIMLLNQLTIWETLNILHKPYYDDFLKAHFDNVKVGDTMVERPQYIGGTSQVININEVLQTSASTETSALGTQGAVASSYDKNYVGSYYCNDYGYIIGVCYIMPDITYLPAMPRGLNKRTKEQFYSPEFSNLSMEAILNKEIFVPNVFQTSQGQAEWLESVFGYTGIFDYLRSNPNYIAGDLLFAGRYNELKAWTLARKFTWNNKPSMTSKFLSIKDNLDLSAWAVPDAPKFMLQCANHIKAVRPMPYVAVPKLA